MTWRGRYFDGKSSHRHDVDIVLSVAALHFRLADGNAVQWPLDQIKWTEKPGDTGISRVGLATDPDARLEVDGDDFVAALRNTFPDIDKAAAIQDRHTRSAVIIGAGCLGLAGLLFVAAYAAPSLIAPLIPTSVTQAIGDNVVREFDPSFPDRTDKASQSCSSPAGDAALERLIARLTKADKRARGLIVRIVNRGSVNAFAAPGGRLVVFKGLVNFAKSPNEFAGVLAHEIGHSIHLHPTKGVIREIGLAATLDLLVGGSGISGQAAGVLVRATYSRDAEEEADDTAADLLTAAGITTEGLATIFDRFAKELSGLPKSLQFFSTHPLSKDRAARIKRRGGSDGEPAMSDADWRAIKAICGGR